MYKFFKFLYRLFLFICLCIISTNVCRTELSLQVSLNVLIGRVIFKIIIHFLEFTCSCNLVAHGELKNSFVKPWQSKYSKLGGDMNARVGEQRCTRSRRMFSVCTSGQLLDRQPVSPLCNHYEKPTTARKRAFCSENTGSIPAIIFVII